MMERKRKEGKRAASAVWQDDGKLKDKRCDSRAKPLILCLIEEANKIKRKDKLEYRGLKYNVVDITNIANMNICKDISLEEIQDG